MKSGLEPEKDLGLVTVESVQGVIHVIVEECNGNIFLRSHTCIEKATAHQFERNGSWLSKTIL